MKRGRGQPVPRRRVLAATLAMAAAVAAVLSLGQALRHPVADAELSGGSADPRVPAECPAPREGQDTREDAPDLAGFPPAEVASGDLYACPEVWDRGAVRLRGEVVGHPTGRGRQQWVQVNDDDYSGELGPLPHHGVFRGANSYVGVLLPTELVGSIGSFGGHSRRGDVVDVVGTFHRVHPGTGEVAVVVADHITVLRAGGPISSEPLAGRRVVAYVLAAAAAGSLLVGRRRDGRE